MQLLKLFSDKKINLRKSFEYFLNLLISNSKLFESDHKKTIQLTKDEISAVLSKQQQVDFKKEV
jgi:hypothetical protein